MKHLVSKLLPGTHEQAGQAHLTCQVSPESLSLLKQQQMRFIHSLQQLNSNSSVKGSFAWRVCWEWWWGLLCFQRSIWCTHPKFMRWFSPRCSFVSGAGRPQPLASLQFSLVLLQKMTRCSSVCSGPTLGIGDHIE